MSRLVSLLLDIPAKLRLYKLVSAAQSTYTKLCFHLLSKLLPWLVQGVHYILCFFRFLKNFPDSVFTRCQCVYTHLAGRKPALQQNWQSSEKSQNFKEKTQFLMNTLYNSLLARAFILSTGCSLKIVFFLKILRFF